jgi:hypothetical protein
MPEIGEVIAKSLETEAVKNLLTPVTRELGLLGGDLGSTPSFARGPAHRVTRSSIVDSRAIESGNGPFQPAQLFPQTVQNLRAVHRELLLNSRERLPGSLW